MSESKFSKKLRDGLTELGVKVSRVESHASCPGMPDIYAIKGFSFWIETKQNDRIKRIHYEPQQALWLEDEWKAGGICLTLLHQPLTETVFLVWGNKSRAAEVDLMAGHPILFPMKGQDWVRNIFETILEEVKE